MINIVFTLASAVLGVAMFALVLFSNAAEAAPAAGSDVAAGKGGEPGRGFSLLAIDDVRTSRQPKGGVSKVAYRSLGVAPTAQMAAQISHGRTSFKQM